MSAQIHTDQDQEALASSLSKELHSLRLLGFAGDIGDDMATRLVGSTDNSIYRLVPSAILFPKDLDDLKLVIEWAHQYAIEITPRGGGTGTNGQSLTQSVVVDLSRHLNNILSFDPRNETVIVQPGVVLDQLNAYLSPFGFFFPPTVSTSSRATIGGMFATDASGKGSRIYGRTSDYVRQLDILLEDGSNHSLADHIPLTGRLKTIADNLQDELCTHAETIRDIFPDMNRGLTGYNLLDAIPAHKDQPPDLIKLLAGSEGTLCFTAALHLKVLRKPTHRALAVMAYPDCQEALDHVPELIAAEPVAIEFLDDKIVDLAAQSPFWPEVQDILGPLKTGRGFLFVEFVGYSEADVQKGLDRHTALVAKNDGGNIGLIATRDMNQINALWEMRKRAVGLLGASKGHRVGIPFVEDAAVPPEKLAAFVKDFRAELDQAGLDYGMFGHADVGCVHVRPMLDMRSASDRAQIRTISDKVTDLTKRYDGLIWGEHGKGVRGEYLLAYVGPDLFALMRRIKAMFDPQGRLNAGKLAIPAGKPGEVVKLDHLPFRGERDAQIDGDNFTAFEKSIACNGNGACYNWSPSDPMCPSYKATRDRVQGPKGRATLFREWSHAASTDSNPSETEQIEQALHDSLSSCLSCHSCSNSCPIRVDIPDMKAHFLYRYFQKHRRPLRDHLVRYMEPLSLMLRQVPRLANGANRLAKGVFEHLFAIKDVPTFSTDRVEQILKRHNVQPLDELDAQVVATQNPDAVCIVPDSFTGIYETQILDATISLLKALGLTVYATPILANGKAQHVRGYLPSFAKRRDATLTKLNQLAQYNMPLIGLEPSVLSLFGREYHESDLPVQYQVQSIDQFLAALDGSKMKLAMLPYGKTYQLFLHCTEKTQDPATANRWQTIFARLGQKLEPMKTGCCGMAGLFGHEKEHQTMSHQLFDMSWRKPMERAINAPDIIPIATGFSCRSQTKRLLGTRPLHPVEAILSLLLQSSQRHDHKEPSPNV